MRKSFIVLLFIVGITTASIRVTSEASYIKVINGDVGVEFLLKTSIPCDGFTVKIGLSEGFTGTRGAPPWQVNHAGYRGDVGVYWTMFGDLNVGYTHSIRDWFSGAYPASVFQYDSQDRLSIGKEFNL